MIRLKRRQFGKVAAATATLATATNGTETQRLGQAASVAVSQTTVQWPGKPLTNALHIAFSNGHRLLWDTDNCRLFAWYDERGVALTSPPTTDLWYLQPEVTVYDFAWQQVPFQVTEYHDAWGTMGIPRPQFVGYTTTTDSITVTYRIPNRNDAQHPYTGTTTYQETYKAETRIIGGVPYNGFSITATVDTGGSVAPGIGRVDIRLICRQTFGGSLNGADGWRFDGDGGGIRQWRFQDGVDLQYNSGNQTFAVVTHSQGTFVTYPVDIRRINAGRALVAMQGCSFGPAQSGQQQMTAGPLVFLYSALDAQVLAPQRYLNVRFAVAREQLRAIGFTPAMMYWFRPCDYVNAGRTSWTAFVANWTQNNKPYSQRRLRVVAHIDTARSRVAGDPSTITGTGPLFPELYFPNAVEYLAPGDPYVEGALQDFRNMNDAARALGVQLDYWIREWYMEKFDPATSTVWSRFDRTWPGSILWKQHPDWVEQNPDGTLKPQPATTPSLAHPDYQAYRRQWVHDGWFINGAHGIFRDTGSIAGGFSWYNRVAYNVSPVDVDFWVYVHTLGMYFLFEHPVPLLLSEYNQGAAWAAQFREWGAPLCFAALSPEGVASSTVDYTNSQYDPVAARRYHCVVAGVGADPSLQMPDVLRPAIQAEAALFASRIDRFGVPDRVEVIGWQRATPAPVTLQTAVTANEPPTGGSIRVSSRFRLPDSGRIQIGDEVLLYRSSGSGETVSDHGEGALNGIIRGYQGTTPAAHAVGDAVVSLDDNMHWTYSDAYWVYGTGADEVWVRYSDGTVWQRGGSVPATVPRISNVQVTTNGTSATISWTTDRPCIGWVEYDTFGTQEIYASQRPAEWWPAYLHRSPATSSGTSHSVTLQDLQRGALYHYRIVVRGPAQAVTPDATFTVLGQALTIQAPLITK